MSQPLSPVPAKAGRWGQFHDLWPVDHEDIHKVSSLRLGSSELTAMDGAVRGYPGVSDGALQFRCRLRPVAGHEQPAMRSIRSCAALPQEPVAQVVAGARAAMFQTEAVEKSFGHNPRTGGKHGMSRRKGGGCLAAKTREQLKLRRCDFVDVPVSFPPFVSANGKAGELANEDRCKQV